MTPRSVRGLLAALLVTLGVSPALAQEQTRAEAIAEAQAQKAKQLHTYEPSSGELMALKFKHALIDDPNGLYPWFDSAYSGGGFTLGAGYRKFYGDRTFWDARGLYSIKNYKRFEIVTTSLGLAHDRINFQAVGGWRDATQVAFYGVGGDTAPEAKSNFRMKQTYVGAQIHGRGPGPVVFDLGGQYEDYNTEQGTGSTPSVEQVYTPATAPGLGANPSYFHLTLGGGIDTRPAAGYARSGGLYDVAYDAYADTGSTYSFDRLQVEGVQHIPILRENWVVSLHGVVTTTLNDDDVVPFFLLPSLGSGSTLRAYPSWRFRDRHSMLMSGEWRWIPSRLALDMALFFDAGKVTSHRDDLNFDGLKTDFGVGLRIHSPAATPLRIDVAHGSEGINIVFSGSAAF
jgi:hypothetical protein